MCSAILSVIYHMEIFTRKILIFLPRGENFVTLIFLSYVKVCIKDEATFTAVIGEIFLYKLFCKQR